MNMLERLNDLHARYDGPVPPQQLRGPLFALNGARENMRFMTGSVRRQIKAIRARRTLGWPDEEYLFNDLRLYWHQRRRYQSEVIRLGKARA